MIDFTGLVEQEYEKLLQGYKSPRGMDGHEMCIRYMLRTTHKDITKQWFFSWEFIGSKLFPEDNLFGSHEAPARICELRTDYPMIFEGRKVGKYVVTRIIYENLENHLGYLPEELIKVFNQELKFKT